MSYKAALNLRTMIELETIDDMCPEEINEVLTKMNEKLMAASKENAQLKARVAELEDELNNVIAGLHSESDINEIKTDAILEAISTLGTHWAENIGEEVIRVDLLERYADKLRRGE